MLLGSRNIIITNRRFATTYRFWSKDVWGAFIPALKCEVFCIPYTPFYKNHEITGLTWKSRVNGFAIAGTDSVIRWLAIFQIDSN